MNLRVYNALRKLAAETIPQPKQSPAGTATKVAAGLLNPAALAAGAAKSASNFLRRKGTPTTGASFNTIGTATHKPAAVSQALLQDVIRSNVVNTVPGGAITGNPEAMRKLKESLSRYNSPRPGIADPLPSYSGR